jgi:hypothetical protein
MKESLKLNRLDGGQCIARLPGQVITVSRKTMKAAKELPELKF